jgi:hypothetical protein
MAPPEVIERVGQRIEADYYFCELNERIFDEESRQPRTVKLPTHGGATAAFLTVDCYSSKVQGWLVDSVSQPVNQVKRGVNQIRKDGHSVEKFAAGKGIVSQSMFRVLLPDVMTYLNQKQIITVCGEAYNHNNGVRLTTTTMVSLIQNGQ